MAVKSYLVTFRPVDVFFWGNEKTLNDDNLSYFVHSNHFPQQTTLLGALRYKLLEANDLLSTGNNAVKPEAQAWIGKNSFSTNQATTTYGYIEQLSPLFLKDSDTIWHFAPKDKGLCFKTLPTRVRMGTATQNSVGYFKDFDPKKGIPKQLLSVSNEGSTCEKLDVFFQEDVRVGIQKNDSDESKALFKQSYFRFKSTSLTFALVAKLDTIAGDCLLNFVKESPFIRLGAEQRSFEMSIAAIENAHEYFNLPLENPSEFTKIILLSDAYVTADIYDHCAGVLSETVDFRNIETNHETQYWNWNKSTQQKRGQYPEKLAIKRNLIEKGSVFYLKKDEEEAFEKKMNAASHFRKIGYNAYLKLNAKGNTSSIHIF